jgi:hypothetical protein
MDRAPAMLCMVNGEERDPYRAYLNLHPIDEASYQELCAAHDGACEFVVAAMWNPEWTDADE